MFGATNSIQFYDTILYDDSMSPFNSIQFDVSIQFVNCTCPSPKGMLTTSLPFELN